VAAGVRAGGRSGEAFLVAGPAPGHVAGALLSGPIRTVPVNHRWLKSERSMRVRA
jgi:hypothetical protein